MGTVISLTEFRRARVVPPSRPAPEPPPVSPSWAAAHPFVAATAGLALAVHLSLIPARIACAALTPWSA